MKAILDTHALLWFARGDQRLPVRIRKLIEQSGPELYVSVASIWEMQIKHDLGKLTLRKPPEDCISSQQSTNALEILTIRPDHVYGLAALPRHHNDPFDRMLVAQALADKLTIATVDPAITAYPAQVLAIR